MWNQSTVNVMVNQNVPPVLKLGGPETIRWVMRDMDCQSNHPSVSQACDRDRAKSTTNFSKKFFVSEICTCKMSNMAICRYSKWMHLNVSQNTQNNNTGDQDKKCHGSDSPIKASVVTDNQPIQWLKKLIHTGSLFSLEAGCTSENKAKPIWNYWNKAFYTGLVCA